MCRAATPLHEIKQAAGHASQNVKEAKWQFGLVVFLFGAFFSVMGGYIAVMRTQNAMDDRLDVSSRFCLRLHRRFLQRPIRLC